MFKIIRDTFTIAIKDLTEFRRDRLRLITFVIMPIFMMILTGFIFPSQNSLKDIKVGIADQDNTQPSQNLVKLISNFKTNDNNVFIVQNYSSLDAIKEGIRKQEISGGLLIPSGFAADIAANKQTQVTIIQDQSNPQISALTNQILAQLISGYGQVVAVQKVQVLLTQSISSSSKIATSSAKVATVSAPTKTPTLSPLAFIQPIRSTIVGLVGGSSNYFEFVAPGIMAMVVMTAVLTGLAGSVSRENEQGTLDGILVAPVKRVSIIMGKAVAQSVRGLIQGFIVLLLAVFLFGVVIHGNLLLVALMLALGIFSFVGLGILVSAAASEQETATQLLFMFQFPMLFLSGAFFPLQQMPGVMQNIAHLLPLTYAVEAERKIIVLGGGLADVQSEMIILLVFGIVTLLIALPLFNRLVKR